MADGLAPAIDKVGEPAPGAPEAEAGAPTVPSIIKPVESQPEEPKLEAPQPATLDGAGPAPALPKPVEVMSVPETPVNAGTPAGGTPRPELKITDDAPSEPTVTTGLQAAPTSAASKPAEEPVLKPAAEVAPVAAVNGKPDAEMAGAIQTEPEKDQADMNAIAAAEETSVDDKKRKLDEVAAPSDAPAVPAVAAPATAPEDSAETNGATTNGAGEEPSAKKIKVNGGEPGPAPDKAAKKDKKPAPAAGRTARKTRSQGPVEV
jgi:hypothetical protein